MYGRAADDAAARLRDLRREEWEDFGVAGLALVGAVAATDVWPALAVPLFVGGLALAARGVWALWHRWDLVDRLAEEPAAYVIPEVLDYASREATRERRWTFAALIRARLSEPEINVQAVADELEALVAELEDDSLLLEPASAVACMRLLSDLGDSSLLDPAAPADELRSRVRRIRSGFGPSVCELE
ncbi:MAG TPA: hypothetical protein VFW80_05370 [Gaiellaceae bacterium]|nr:hypothetical protein [Gaiellaceae bacterium]